MSDPSLLTAAMRATGLTAGGVAARALDVEERTVNRWRDGTRELRGPAAVLCRLLVLRPSLLPLIEKAVRLNAEAEPREAL